MRDYYRDLSMGKQREEAIIKLYSIDEDRMIQIRANTEEATDADIWRCSPDSHTEKDAPVVSTSTNSEICELKPCIPTPCSTK